MRLYKAESEAKKSDLMTQITFQMKKLEIKDNRKRVERSLKKRKKYEKSRSKAKVESRRVEQ